MIETILCNKFINKSKTLKQKPCNIVSKPGLLINSYQFVNKEFFRSSSFATNEGLQKKRINK